MLSLVPACRSTQCAPKHNGDAWRKRDRATKKIQPNIHIKRRLYNDCRAYLSQYIKPTDRLSANLRYQPSAAKLLRIETCQYTIVCQSACVSKPKHLLHLLLLLYNHWIYCLFERNQHTRCYSLTIKHSRGTCQQSNDIPPRRSPVSFYTLHFINIIFMWAALYASFTFISTLSMASRIKQLFWQFAWLA